MAENQSQKNDNRYTHVSLADAYQRLGKAEYNDWVDYDICVHHEEKYQLTNLQSFVQPNSHQGNEPQIFSIDFADLTWSTPSVKQKQEHKRLEKLLRKLIAGDAFKISCVGANGKPYELPSEIWGDESGRVEISIIESVIFIRDSNDVHTYRILVEPNSLEKWTKQITKQRKKHEANKKRTGRPTSSNQHKIDEIVASVQIKYPELSKLERGKIVEGQLKKMGITKPDADGLRKLFK